MPATNSLRKSAADVAGQRLRDQVRGTTKTDRCGQWDHASDQDRGRPRDRALRFRHTERPQGDHRHRHPVDAPTLGDATGTVFGTALRPSRINAAMAKVIAVIAIPTGVAGACRSAVLLYIDTASALTTNDTWI